MLHLTFVFIGLLASCNGASLLSRIVGGTTAKISDFPYQVSIRISGFHICGGSILNNRWLLTAAHCIVKYKPADITLVVGTNYLSTGGIAYKANSIILHMDYVREKQVHDIALIKTEVEITFTDKIAPVALPTADVDESNCIANFTGWGYTDKYSANSNSLQVIEFKVIALSECQNTFQKVIPTHLCTYNIIGEGLCYGDSGSPLVFHGAQIGIGSWGSPCALGYPDVHTRVYSYLSWIEETIS
ncbi:chymotrypsin-1 [Cephus cinctus]|uniref:chymotrypsin n=1 Tax=Cephus cinctus TaxID=211228 RepID=A0AAJ7FPV0_CEPCN|nr:chymotrypsin-1 [Cephus cinctus]